MPAMRCGASRPARRSPATIPSSTLKSRCCRGGNSRRSGRQAEPSSSPAPEVAGGTARGLPHEGVYVRLGLSAIHGIGVFAIRVIPRGTNIFANDKVEMTWVDKADLAAAHPTPAERSFYEDFGIQSGDRIGCPVNFHNLTPGWYRHEPAPGEEAKVASDAAFNFTAARDIEEGEELTIRYRDFSSADA